MEFAPAVATVFLAVAAVTPVPGDRLPADRDAIRAHIDEIFRAYMRRDRAVVRATHAADWRGFIRPSRSIVRGIDQYMAEAEGILGSPGVLKAYEMVDFDVLFYGDTALVPYVARIEWAEDGITHPDTLRVLDVYAKVGGHWNQVGSQVATHPDALAAARQQARPLSDRERRALLADRESVWRAYFAGDVKLLADALPEDTIAINAGEETWVEREGILAGARDFSRSGGKLVRLEFPTTEIRAYGDVAILYTTYRLEVEQGGQRRTESGRGTEIFVYREGRWVNPGWHLDSGR
jgi:ketosteroid isomerase-like protein